MESDNYIDSLKFDLKMHSALAPYQAQGEADDIVDRYVLPAVQAVVEELGRDFDANIPQLEIDVGRVRLQDLREAIESALRSALERYRISSGESFVPIVASLQEYTDAGIVPWENGGQPFSPSHLLKEFLKDDPDTFQESMESFSEKELVGLLMATAMDSDAESMTRVLPIREAILARLSRDYPETAAVLTARMDVWRQFGEVLASLSVVDDEDTIVSAEATSDTVELPEPAPRAFRYIEIDQRDVPDDYPVVSMEYSDTPGEEAPEFIVIPGTPRRYFRKISADIMADSSAPLREESKAAAAATAATAATLPAEDIIVDSTETLREGSGTPVDNTVRVDGIMADSSEAQREELEASDRTVPEGGIVADSSETVRERPDTATDKTVRADGIIADSSKAEREDLETVEKKVVLADGIVVESSDVLREEMEEVGDKTMVAADPVTDSSEALTGDLETAGSKEVAVADGNGIVQEKEAAMEIVQEGISLETGRYRYVGIDSTDIPEGYPVVPMDFSVTPDEKDPEYIVSITPPLKYFRKVPVGWKEGIFEEKDIRSEATGEEFKGGEDQLVVAEEATGAEEAMARKAATGRTMESELMPEKDRINGKKIIEEKTETAESSKGTEIAVTEEEKQERRKKAEKIVTGGFRYVEIGLTDIPEGCPVVTKEYTDAPDVNAPEYIVSIGSTLKYYRKVSVSSSGISLNRDGKPDRPMIQSETEQKHEISEEEAVEDTKGEDGDKVGAEYYRKAETGLRNDHDGKTAETGREFRDVRSVWEIRDFESDIPDGRIPISDAGLVLLHPFIGRMMANLGLVKEGMFVSPLARIRAVHLLRDLTGSDEPHHNHNLILEKVLCGLPVGYLLPPEWKPTKREKEETEALLRAVCDYWKPLSKSSTLALCGSFIHRAGAIERFQDTWTIRVEGRTIDILMDDLPWEISIIYLPWLETPLAVEWQRE